MGRREKQKLAHFDKSAQEETLIIEQVYRARNKERKKKKQPNIKREVTGTRGMAREKGRRILCVALRDIVVIDDEYRGR